MNSHESNEKKSLKELKEVDIDQEDSEKNSGKKDRGIHPKEYKVKSQSPTMNVSSLKKMLKEKGSYHNFNQKTRESGNKVKSKLNKKEPLKNNSGKTKFNLKSPALKSLYKTTRKNGRTKSRFKFDDIFRKSTFTKHNSINSIDTLFKSHEKLNSKKMNKQYSNLDRLSLSKEKEEVKPRKRSDEYFSTGSSEFLSILKNNDPRKQVRELEKFLEGQNLQKHTQRYIEFIVNALCHRVEELQGHFSAFYERHNFQVSDFKNQISELEETNSRLMKHFLEKESQMNDKLFEVMCQCQDYLKEKELLQDKIEALEKHRKAGTKKKVYNFMINNNNNNAAPTNNAQESAPKITRSKFYTFSSSKDSSNASLHSGFDVSNLSKLNYTDREVLSLLQRAEEQRIVQHKRPREGILQPNHLYSSRKRPNSP